MLSNASLHQDAYRHVLAAWTGYENSLVAAHVASMSDLAPTITALARSATGFVEALATHSRALFGSTGGTALEHARTGSATLRSLSDFADSLHPGDLFDEDAVAARLLEGHGQLLRSLDVLKSGDASYQRAAGATHLRVVTTS